MIIPDFKRAFKHGARFAFFGPLVGLLITLFALFAYYLFAAGWNSTQSIGQQLTAAGIIILFGLVTTYFIGFLPAFLTGFVSSFGNSKRMEIILALSIGAASSFIMPKILSMNGFPAQLLAIVGSLSALACVQISHHHYSKRINKKN